MIVYLKIIIGWGVLVIPAMAYWAIVLNIYPVIAAIICGFVFSYLLDGGMDKKT